MKLPIMVTQRRTIPLTEPFRVKPHKIRHSLRHLHLSLPLLRAPQPINPLPRNLLLHLPPLHLPRTLNHHHQKINPPIPTKSSLPLTPLSQTTPLLEEMVEVTPFPSTPRFLRVVTSRLSRLLTQARGGGSLRSPTSVYAPTR